MNTRTVLASSILSAALLAGAGNVCEARFANLPAAYALQDGTTPPGATLPDISRPDVPGSDTSPITSQRAVPLGGTRNDRQVLIQTLIASPDSANVTYKLHFGKDLRLDGYALNDRRSPYGAARLTDPTFAPDSNSVAVVVFLERSWILHHKKQMLDGYEPVSPVRFSPDGQRLIYLARLETQRFVVEGDTPHPRADRIAWDQLVFSPDSSALAYPAYDGRHWRMVINGDPGPTWERIATKPITAQSGPGVFYVAVKDGRYHLVDRHTTDPGSGGGGGSGGDSGGGFRFIEGPPVLSADGSTFAYWTMSDDLRWRVFRNHQPVPGYDADRPGQLIISPDGQTLAAILKRDGQWRVVLNGTPGTPGTPGTAYPAIGKGSLTLSPDGSRIAYAVKTPRGWAVVADGREQQAYLQLAAGSLRFSPDSQHLAYAALTQGQWSVILDNQTHQPFNQINASSLTFSPDSNRLTYLAQRRGWTNVVIDGEVVGEYDQVEQLTFSPQSNHLVWLARQDGRSFLVVDGTPSDEPFYQLVPGAKIQFTTDTACHTVAIRRPGPSFVRIELKLAPAPAPGSDDTSSPSPGSPAPPAPMSPFVDVPTE